VNILIDTRNNDVVSIGYNYIVLKNSVVVVDSKEQLITVYVDINNSNSSVDTVEYSDIVPESYIIRSYSFINGDLQQK